MQKPILFINNFLRNEFWEAQTFFYNILRSAVPSTVELIQPNELDNLKKLAIDQGVNWISSYRDMPEDIGKEFLSIISTYSPQLVIFYEMPLCCEQLLNAAKITFINIRISPIRFLPDLLIYIKSNVTTINEKIHPWSISPGEIKRCGLLVQAQFFHNNSHQISSVNTNIFIGQTESDASIILEDGTIARINLVIEKFRLHGKKILYCPHPFASIDHIGNEIKTLHKYFCEVVRSSHPIYELIISYRKCSFYTISSGTLEEVPFLTENYFMGSLIDPILKYEDNELFHIPSATLLEQKFWSDILDIPIEKPFSGSYRFNHSLRDLHSVWWGFAGLQGQQSRLHNEILKFSPIIINLQESLTTKTDQIVLTQKLIDQRVLSIENYFTYSLSFKKIITTVFHYFFIRLKKIFLRA